MNLLDVIMNDNKRNLIGSLMSLYGPTFLVTPVDLCIIFQCNLYISCIMSCGNKIVSKKKMDVIMNANKVTSVNFEILLVSRLEKVLISHQNPPPHKWGLAGRPPHRWGLSVSLLTNEASLWGLLTNEASLWGLLTNEASLWGLLTNEASLWGLLTNEASLWGLLTNEASLGYTTRTSFIVNAEQQNFIELLCTIYFIIYKVNNTFYYYYFLLSTNKCSRWNYWFNWCILVTIYIHQINLHLLHLFSNMIHMH